MKKSLIKIISFFIIITVALGLIQQNMNSTSKEEPTEKRQEKITETKEVTLSKWIELYNNNNYKKVEIEDGIDMKGFIYTWTGTKPSLFGINKEVDQYILIKTKKPLDTSINELGLSLTGATSINTIYNEKSWFMLLLEQFGVMILILILFIIGARFILGKGGNGAGGLMNIQVWKKSTKETSKTKFSDIAGMEEVKNELEEVVDYLKNPQKYQKVWARHPKGVLLYGEPGSGKTLLARAVAGEADVAFFSASGSEFMEMLVGMGAAKVRTLFKQAKEAGKAIIFIDEIDAIGKRRGNGNTGGHQEQEQTLNQILTEMDGFDNETNIIVMAATNRPDILDPALLRAGRFDRKIFVTAPTAEEREAIFKYYLKKKKVSPKVKLTSLVKRTSWLVGADIENIVNEASLKIAKEERTTLEVNDFEYALEKVIMGPEKKTKDIQEKEKQITAYHELGHALLAHIQSEADPVEKISIVRRGHALWVTWTTPTEDKNLYSKRYLLSELSVMLAGRAAEEIFFWKEEITTGASNDFERANKTIRNMLIKFGMDDELWMVVYEENQNDMTFFKPYSENTAQQIDKKIKEYLEQSYKISKEIILNNKETLTKIAKILIEKEYISGEEFAEMIEHPEDIEKYQNKEDEKIKKEKK